MDKNDTVPSFEEFDLKIQQAEDRQKKFKIATNASFGVAIASLIGLVLTAWLFLPAFPVFLALVPASFLGAYFSMSGERKAKHEISNLKQEKQIVEEKKVKVAKGVSKEINGVKTKSAGKSRSVKNSAKSAVEEQMITVSTDEINVD